MRLNHPSTAGTLSDIVLSYLRPTGTPDRGAGRLWIDLTPAIERACLQRIARSYKLPPDVKTQAAQRLERKAV